MSREHAKELLRGGYELHVHTAPSHYNRRYDDFEYARELDRYGMAGSIIKTHFGSTTARATLCNRYGGFKAQLYGEITLDWAVGGLNPHAVRSELLLGGRIVFMPTFHALSNQIANQFKAHPVGGPGITVLDENGQLLPVVYEIMDVVKEFNAVLATGHLSAEESYKLATVGLDRGVTMMLTHPDSLTENIPVEWQAELAQKGAFVEKCWLNVIKEAVTPDEMCARVRAIGPQHCVLTTDLGQVQFTPPAEGMLDFIECLINHGFTDEDILQMVRYNPKKLLRIE